MARILLRARKGPFDVVSPARSLRRDAFGSNAGNLVFSHTAHKILATSVSSVDHGQMPARPDEAGMINERYDAFVVPLANAFRHSFATSLRALTDLIQRLKIPVVVLGVGAQTDTGYDLERLKSIDHLVKEFVSAVLDRSASIGVRGELTGEYLRHLGFGDDQVDVIGCPSIFLHGRGFRLENPTGTLSTDDRIAMTVSPYVQQMGDVVMRHYERYPNLLYIPQNTVDLRMMLQGDQPDDAGKVSKIPIYTSHPLYTEKKMRFFVDPWTWIDHLRNFRFTFGTRIHGSIVSVLAGTPAYVLAHDSRTLELARYFDLPYRTIDKVRGDTDAAELYEEADYSAFNAGYEARLDTMIEFLDKNGLHHIFEPGESGESFDERLSDTPFPDPVVPKAAGKIARGGKQARTAAGRQVRTQGQQAEPGAKKTAAKKTGAKKAGAKKAGAKKAAAKKSAAEKATAANGTAETPAAKKAASERPASAKAASSPKSTGGSGRGLGGLLDRLLGRKRRTGTGAGG